LKVQASANKKLVLVLALLVGNATAGLASGLARSLAFAAATVVQACSQITGFQSLDMVHGSVTPFLLLTGRRAAPESI